jgi:hypothetical protein
MSEDIVASGGERTEVVGARSDDRVRGEDMFLLV